MNGYLNNKLSCWHRIRISQGATAARNLTAAKDKGKDTLHLFCISLVLRPPFVITPYSFSKLSPE